MGLFRLFKSVGLRLEIHSGLANQYGFVAIGCAASGAGSSLRGWRSLAPFSKG
jgi:hypothetical protein